MPNGKPGDHPLTDILIHGIRTFSEQADKLIVEINRLGGKRELEKLKLTGPQNVAALEKKLVKLRDQLAKKKPRSGGW
jgi:hypothetical protein